MMSSMDDAMRQQADMMGMPPEAKPEIDRVRSELRAWWSELFSWDEMRNVYADLYMAVFSEQELRELVEFYRSPIGRKLITRMPELMQRSMQASMERVQRLMPEFQRRFEAAMREVEAKYRAE